MEKILGDMLLAVCDIARVNKVPAEQVLTDRTDDLIEQYESRKMP